MATIMDTMYTTTAMATIDIHREARARNLAVDPMADGMSITTMADTQKARVESPIHPLLVEEVATMVADGRYTITSIAASLIVIEAPCNNKYRKNKKWKNGKWKKKWNKSKYNTSIPTEDPQKLTRLELDTGPDNVIRPQLAPGQPEGKVHYAPNQKSTELVIKMRVYVWDDLEFGGLLLRLFVCGDDLS